MSASSIISAPTAPGSGRLPQDKVFDSTDWLSFGITASVALTVYLATMGPEVNVFYSGMHSTAAKYAGVSLPPGYPLWICWAWLFIKLIPFSNVAWRASISSATAASLACGVIALMISQCGRQVLKQFADVRRPGQNERRWLRIGSGCAAGLGLGFSQTFWSKALGAEPWTLSILLLCIVFALGLRWIGFPGKRRYFLGAAFVYGLLVTNSQIELALAPAIPFVVLLGSVSIARDLFLTASIVFLAGLAANYTGVLPFLTFFGGDSVFLFILIGTISILMTVALVIKTRAAFSEWWTVLGGCSLLLLGFASCFLAPIFSMSNPPLNWSYARTVEGFFHLISRGQFERMDAVSDPHQFLGQVRDYFWIAGRDYGWLYLTIGTVPFLFLARFDPATRKWICGLLAPYFCLAFLILAVLNPSRNQLMHYSDMITVFYSASYVVLSLWAGIGLLILGRLAIRFMARTDHD